MVAVGENAEALFSSRLFHNRVKADAARLVLGSGNGEGQLHGLLVLLKAFTVVTPPLNLIRGMQAILVAHFAQLHVNGVSGEFAPGAGTVLLAIVLFVQRRRSAHYFGPGDTRG